MLLPQGAMADASGTYGDNITWTYQDATKTLTFEGTGKMFDLWYDAFAPWENYRYNIEKIIIGEGVTSIGMRSFYLHTSLNYVSIPNSVTTIEESAFQYCTGLTSITIPNSVDIIRASSFAGCTGLSSFTIPKSVTRIEESAFQDCKGLTIITIPSSVTWIGRWAFQGCIGLTSITIPNSVTYINSGVFRDCTGLSSFTIPINVTSIGTSAFNGCTGLSSITIPSNVTFIASSAFRGCTGLNSIIVDSDNTFLDSRNNCNAIIDTSSNFLICGCKNTIIPNSVFRIGNTSFRDCTGLTTITIPNSVTEIGSSAFDGCSGLISIIIPNSVTHLESRAFRGCTSLNHFYFYSEQVATVVTGNTIFKDTPINNATLHVPAGALDEFKATEPWKDFGNIVALTDDDPKPTGINKVQSEGLRVNDYYDLQGRKVANPERGIYIVNGKKIVKK